MAPKQANFKLVQGVNSSTTASRLSETSLYSHMEATAADALAMADFQQEFSSEKLSGRECLEQDPPLSITDPAESTLILYPIN